MAAERVARLVRTWVASERDEEVQAIALDIGSGEIALLDVVKALGEYLTSEEDELRTKGVELLSRVLQRCPPEKLNRQSVRVLVAFYCDKLDDTETIVPALKGLVSLTSLPMLTSPDAVEVMRALIKHVKMKALVQSQRFTVFTVVDTLLTRHRDALKNMGPEFLSGYVSLAEGEKDPRNLLLAFSIARVIIIGFDVSAHIEDFFNITFCYFPITFRPPPDDPYGITTEDLKVALRGCLNATPAFGPLAIPLLLDKLMAGSPVTKRDTLQIFNEGLPVYGRAVARNSARKLWNSFKLEIFQPTDTQTEEAALKSTQILIQTLYSGSPASIAGDDIEGLAKEACEECLNILKEPEKSQAQPAIKVLCVFMSTTPSVAKFTLSKATPHLIRLFLNPDEIANRGAILKLLSDLIKAARESMSKDPEVLPTEGDAPLSPFKDEILGVLTVGLKALSSAQPALSGLKEVVLTRGLLSDEELGFVVHNVNELLQKEGEESEEVREPALDVLNTVSQFAAWHVSSTTLPLLFSELPDKAPPRDAEAERFSYWRTLDSLQRLCKQSDLFETLVIRLLTKLDLVCIPSSDAEPAEDAEPTAAYAHSLLKAIADVLAAKVDAGHPDVVKYIDQLVPRLYHLFIFSSLVSGTQPTVMNEPRLISVAAQIIPLVTQTLPAPRQTSFVGSLFAGYFGDNISQLAEGQQKMSADARFTPFASEAPEAQSNLVTLFSAGVVALHKEVALPVPDENVFLSTTLRWIHDEARTASQREAMRHTITSVVNKRADGLATFLNEELDIFWKSYIADATKPLQTRREGLLTWAWVTKGLLLRGHALAMQQTDRLFTLFDDSDVSWDAARSIGRIVVTDKVLTKKNHAVVKILYAQKFCNSILPRIIGGAKSKDLEQKQQNTYLVALTSLIKSVPQSTYVHEMPTLLPLLLRGLSLPDMEIRANVIDTMLAAADTSNAKDNSLIAEHASSLVATMLSNSMVREMPSVRVRIAALQYLAKLPSVVRYDILHPQKALVLRELAKVLDDPKRAVRKEAVEARTNWFKFAG